MLQLKEDIKHGRTRQFELTQDRLLQYQNRLCAPNIIELSKGIKAEVHYLRYSIYLGSTKYIMTWKKCIGWET